MSFTPRSLRDLDARFIRLDVRVEIRRRVRPEIWEMRKDGPWAESDFYDWEGPCDYLVDVDAIGDADGLRLLCPKCYDDPPVGPVGTHSVICWSPKVSQDWGMRSGQFAFENGCRLQTSALRRVSRDPPSHASRIINSH